ncbi:MAG: hypothetical protein Q8P12_07950 [bacterium]|nr:hypothetical protein [bacterium]
MPDEQKQQPKTIPQEPKEEKLEFLKREEVRTMAKDIARVRERESRLQQERIAGLKPGETKPAQPKPQVALSQREPATKEGTPSAPLMGKRSPLRFEKVFIRIVVGGIILFLIFNAVALAAWLLLNRDAGTQQAPEQQETTAPLPEPMQEEPGTEETEEALEEELLPSPDENTKEAVE